MPLPGSGASSGQPLAMATVVVDEDEYEQRVFAELDEAIRNDLIAETARRMTKISATIDQCNEIMRTQKPHTKQYARAAERRAASVTKQASMLADADMEDQEFKDIDIFVQPDLNVNPELDLRPSISVNEEDHTDPQSAEDSLAIEDDYDDDVYAERMIKYHDNLHQNGKDMANLDNIQVEGTSWGIPAALHSQLLPYQIEGAEWLLRRFQLGAGGILADEMVLGHVSVPICYLLFVTSFFLTIPHLDNHLGLGENRPGFGGGCCPFQWQRRTGLCVGGCPCHIGCPMGCRVPSLASAPASNRITSFVASFWNVITCHASSWKFARCHLLFHDHFEDPAFARTAPLDSCHS